jgi:hypothetical protein
LPLCSYTWQLGADKHVENNLHAPMYLQACVQNLSTL